MKNVATRQGPENFLLYDGECPVCSNYVAWTNLRSARPDIEVRDAREAPELVERFRRQGIEINDSMILQLGEMTLHGSDAFAVVTSLGRFRGGFMSVVLKFLSRPHVARPIYPLMVLARKALLFALGRRLI
jgi:predicted DCC family thiol-disulfide oxidoreductase YuxK